MDFARKFIGKDLIDALDYKVTDDVVNDCVICLCKRVDHEEMLCHIKCQGLYHSTCAIKWFNSGIGSGFVTAVKCPYCKVRLITP